MKIGELAQLAGCSTETVRFYEKKGLLKKPVRADNNYREYGQSHLERLRFIRNCRALDMSHHEVQLLIHFIEGETESCGDINDLLEAHLHHVQKRIEELCQLEKQLNGLLTQCKEAQSVDDCGILQALTNTKLEPVAVRGQNHIEKDIC